MKTPPQPELTGRSVCRRPHVPPLGATSCVTLALTLCVGCGRDAPSATVEGTLRLSGKSLDNCLITFLPEPGQDANGPHSTGLTDRHGSYRLRCDNQQEGAAIGWHRVTVQDLSVCTGVRRRDHGAIDAKVEETGPSTPVRPSRVSLRFMSLRDTPLRKEVKPGHQIIDLDIN